MFGLHYRPGCLPDLRDGIQLLQAERVPLGPRVWSSLPRLLSNLLEQQRANIYVIEENAGVRLRWFGLSAFIKPEVLSIALGQSTIPFRRFLFEAALDRECPFLSQKEIALSNAAGKLALTVLLCEPDVGEYTHEQGALLFRIAYESFCFAHAGFGLASFWQEVADRKRAGVLDGLGLQSHRSLQTEEGAEHILLNYTRERAVANPGHAMSFIFNQPMPRFGFSRAQQQLLESALLDVSDKDFAISQRVTDDAVKKRWRAIYDRVSAIEPGLTTAVLVGSNQRRQLLGYLRQHLEELRPYDSRQVVQTISSPGADQSPTSEPNAGLTSPVARICATSPALD